MRLTDSFQLIIRGSEGDLYAMNELSCSLSRIIGLVIFREPGIINLLNANRKESDYV